jgi:hypothetical protein
MKGAAAWKRRTDMAKQELWGEEEHGLGINRKVPREKVEALEGAIFSAPRMSEALGVNWERFLEPCNAAVDVAGTEEECIAP